MKISPIALLAAIVLAATATPASAQFTAGNVVVYQVGDGSGSLVNTGNVVRLREFTSAGGSGQTVTLPSTGTGFKLIASGTTTSEGMMTLGNGGRTLALTGYNTTTGGSTLTGTTSASVNRIVALVNGSAPSNASTGVNYTSLTDFADGSSPRGAFTTNGTDIWVSGGSGGVRHATSGSTTSTQVSTTNVRGLSVFGGQLYASTTSGSVRLGTVGTGTPTTGGQTITNLPGFPSSTGSPFQFAFFRFEDPANPLTFAGPNVLYVADDAAGSGAPFGQIQKYTFNGSTWNLNGVVPAAGVRGLTGTITADNQVTLFATTGSSSSTGGGALWTLNDGSGTGTLSSTLTTLSTAANNTAYRGVAFAPATLVYSGSGNWDTVPGHANWTNTDRTTGQASTYVNVYAANFGNISVDKTVNVDSGLYPQAVNVTNAANTYTFANMVSSNGIQGLGSLTKSGAGTLVLASPNLYAGGTTISGGTLTVSNTTGSATGVGGVVVNGGTLSGTGIIAPLDGFGVAINSGGTLRPWEAGGAPLTIGSPGVNNPVTLGAGSILSLRVTVAGSPAGTGTGGSSTGTNNTLLLVLGTGDLTIDPNATFAIEGTNAGFVVGRTYSYKIAQGPNSLVS